MKLDHCVRVPDDDHSEIHPNHFVLSVAFAFITTKTKLILLLTDLIDIRIHKVFHFIANLASTGWSCIMESCRKWRRGNTGRENMDISAICNTSYGRWTYHKAQREVAITHHVVCAMFPVLSAGQAAQRPGS